MSWMDRISLFSPDAFLTTMSETKYIDLYKDLANKAGNIDSLTNKLKLNNLTPEELTKLRNAFEKALGEYDKSLEAVLKNMTPEDRAKFTEKILDQIGTYRIQVQDIAKKAVDPNLSADVRAKYADIGLMLSNYSQEKIKGLKKDIKVYEKLEDKINQMIAALKQDADKLIEAIKKGGLLDLVDQKLLKNALELQAEDKAGMPRWYDPVGASIFNSISKTDKNDQYWSFFQKINDDYNKIIEKMLEGDKESERICKRKEEKEQFDEYILKLIKNNKELFNKLLIKAIELKKEGAIVDLQGLYDKIKSTASEKEKIDVEFEIKEIRRNSIKK